MKKEGLDRTDKSKAVQDNSSFFIFLCQKFFNLRDIFIVYFLKFGFRILLLVFGHTLFNGLFQCVYSVTACVAYTYFCGFAFAFTLFGQLLAAFLCQWRNTQTDNFTVVFGSDAQIRVHDSFFDDTEHTFVPWLDGDTACIGSSHGSYITDGNHASIRVNTNAVQQPGTGFSCTNVR